MASDVSAPVHPRPAVAWEIVPPAPDHRRDRPPLAFLDALAAHVEWSTIGGEGPVDGLVLSEGEPTDRLRAEAAVRLERSPHAVVAVMSDLASPDLRHHFLARLYAVAELRAVERSRSKAELVRFHSDHKLVLMAQSPSGQYRLGRIVANQDRLPFESLLRSYREELTTVIMDPPRPPRVVNALQHAFGYFSERLLESERRGYLIRLERYPHGEVPLAALIEPMRAWITRYDIEYLARQSIFHPYPMALARWTGALDAPH